MSEQGVGIPTLRTISRPTLVGRCSAKQVSRDAGWALLSSSREELGGPGPTLSCDREEIREPESGWPVIKDHRLSVPKTSKRAMSFVNPAHFWADLLETGWNLTKFANRTQHYHLGEKSKQLWQVAPAYKGSMYTRDRNVEHTPHVVRAAPARKCPFHPAESDSPPDIYANCRLCRSARLYDVLLG
ncbi:hypothetical protein BDZ89DRAFT_1042021 [Hymenopellis radicata]|nr:hypothetical protein BDZ89DRAFT_1042021 [Hymenopellis radicata]